MEEQKKPSNAKKTAFSLIGGFLILGLFAGGNFRHLADWSTAELVGYNTFALITIFGSIYLIHLGTKK